MTIISEQNYTWSGVTSYKFTWRGDMKLYEGKTLCGIIPKGCIVAIIDQDIDLTKTTNGNLAPSI